MKKLTKRNLQVGDIYYNSITHHLDVIEDEKDLKDVKQYWRVFYYTPTIKIFKLVEEVLAKAQSKIKIQKVLIKKLKQI